MEVARAGLNACVQGVQNINPGRMTSDPLAIIRIGAERVNFINFGRTGEVLSRATTLVANNVSPGEL